MYSRPSVSQRREPCARSMIRGAPPTARNARTGLFTPSTRIFCARSRKSDERESGGTVESYYETTTAATANGVYIEERFIDCVHRDWRYIEERSLDCVPRRAETARREKARDSARDDGQTQVLASLGMTVGSIRFSRLSASGLRPWRDRSK